VLRQHATQRLDIEGGFSGREIDARDSFGLGEAALQSDHKREILPHPGGGTGWAAARRRVASAFGNCFESA